MPVVGNNARTRITLRRSPLDTTRRAFTSDLCELLPVHEQKLVVDFLPEGPQLPPHAPQHVVRYAVVQSRTSHHGTMPRCGSTLRLETSPTVEGAQTVFLSVSSYGGGGGGYSDSISCLLMSTDFWSTIFGSILVEIIRMSMSN